MLNIKGKDYEVFVNDFGVEYVRIKGTYRPIINGKIRMFLSRLSQKHMKSIPPSCEYCIKLGLVPNPKHNWYEIDHIMALWVGGTDDISNLRWLCMRHNRGRKHGNGGFTGQSVRWFL